MKGTSLPQFNLTQVRSLEATMDSLTTVAERIGDNETVRNARHLRYLIAEMRVLSANPRDPEAINRFTELFTE